VCLLEDYLPSKTVHHGKGAFIIVHVSNISQHSTGYNTIRSHNQIGNGTVEDGHSQPRFGWQLKAPTEKVTNDIAVADNHFKFMLIFLPRLAAINMIVKGALYTTLVLINLGNRCLVHLFRRRNNGRWSVDSGKSHRSIPSELSEKVRVRSIIQWKASSPSLA
jgi:hypothetical protein